MPRRSATSTRSSSCRLSTGGGRYDVLFVDEPWVPPLSEFLLPLTERMKTLDVADFIPTTVASGAFQGTQYAIPVDPNVQLLVYRKDLFEAKGLKPPATWDELLAAAKALHDPAKEKYGIAVTASSDIQTALYMLLAQWSYGAELVDGGRGSLNSAAGRKGGEVFLELLKFTPPNVRSYNFADVNKAIQLGQAAMAIQWASGAKPMEDKTQVHRGRQARLHARAQGRAADADARRVDDRHRQEQRQPGCGLAVRDLAVRQGVRPVRRHVSLARPRRSTARACRCSRIRARRRRCRTPRRCSTACRSPRSGRGCASTPTSRRIFG